MIPYGLLISAITSQIGLSVARTGIRISLEELAKIFKDDSIKDLAEDLDPLRLVQKRNRNAKKIKAMKS